MQHQPESRSTLTVDEAAALALREQQAGRLETAQALYRKILEHTPGHHAALHAMGVMAYRRKDYRQAAKWIEEAIASSAAHANYFNTLGACYRALGRSADALTCYDRAIELDPQAVSPYANRANALQDLGRYEEAIPCARRAAELQPASADAWMALANMETSAGDVQQAIAHYQRALDLQPDHAKCHFAHALALLMAGDYAQGWPEYEWRLESHARRMGVLRDFARPRWDGLPLEGKTILVHCEQGFGDALQFVRYVPLVAQRGGVVVLECRPELRRLFQQVQGVSTVINRGEALPAFDVHCPLLSLPLMFRTTLQTVPAKVPYLSAPPDAVTHWNRRVANTPHVRVGIAWSGSPTSALAARKSCPLPEFRPVSQLPDMRLYSLQKGSGALALTATDEGAPSVVDWTSELVDFADTAALVAGLDLVISIDTAVAHLAGALGKPVWLLLSYEGDWRWLQDRADSPWYPRMRIFRQPAPGDWASVMREVTQALSRIGRTPD